MKFYSQNRETIIEKTGSMLAALLGSQEICHIMLVGPDLAALDDKDRFIQFIGDLGTEETNKQLDESFLNVIHKAGLKDKFATLMTFLLGVHNDIDKAYGDLQAAAWGWITDFLCDDKNHFRHLAVYLGIAKSLGKIIEEFFLKFTNTKKHGKIKRIIGGKAVLHDLYEYSPVSSHDLQLDLFKIDVYGEACERVNGKYKEIILLIIEIYEFSVHVDRFAQLVKDNPETCKEYLGNMLKEFRSERLKSQQKTNMVFYPQEIEEAKMALPRKVVDLIANGSLADISQKLYHELAHACGYNFSILVWARIQDQSKLTDQEYQEVFKHIEDKEERRRKAMQARVLYAHWDELARKMVGNEAENEKKHLDKGKMVYLMKKWTGTMMSQNAFVKDYHNAMCKCKDYHIGVTTLQTIESEDKIGENLERRFELEAQTIIDKYQLTMDTPLATASAAPAPVAVEIPMGLMTGEETLRVDIQNAAQF